MEKAEEKPKGIWKLPDDLSGILSLLTTVLGAITGLVSVFYLIGYIVVNQRLLSLGVREFTLGNPAYLSAGISSTIIHAIAIVIPILIGRARKLLILAPALSALVVLFTLGVMTSVQMNSREFYVYLFGIPLLVFCIDLVSSKERRDKLDPEERSWIILIFFAVPIFFFIMLAVWSRQIYPQLNASYGGGKPVRVQLVIADSDKISLFTQMGIHVNENTTESLELVDDNGATLLLLLSNGNSARIDKTLVASILYLHPRSVLASSTSTLTPGSSTLITTPVPRLTSPP
jgi:hypothetical protein